MKLFLYEHLTACGAGEASLMREGEAMVRALAADIATLPKMNVIVARNPRLPPLELGPRVTCVDPHLEHADSLEDFAKAIFSLRRKTDWGLVVAPETNHRMMFLALLVEEIAGRCLHPYGASAALAADKRIFADRLKLIGAPTPRIWPLLSTEEGAPEEPLPEDWSFPSVIKPIDGAGSIGVRLVESRDQFEREGLGANEFLQELVRGTPVSAACICNERRFEVLEPCLQILGGDSGFEYLGGRVPLDRILAARAASLAEEAVICLQYEGKAPRGYVGVDMVLGEAPDGSQDYIIEVNPRITTSYVGLRKYYKGNLASAMIDVALGRIPKLTPRNVEVEWDSAGNVTVTDKK